MLLRSLALPAALAGLALVLSGCASTVNLDPAEDSAAVDCAAVIARAPVTVADQPARETDAQGTAAWGDPASILLRCGVPTPGPTTDPCVSVNGVDWVEDDSNAPRYRFTTFGRTPAVEVILDYGTVSGSTTLADLSSAVDTIPTTGQCTDVGDVAPPASGTPTSTPAP